MKDKEEKKPSLGVFLEYIGGVMIALIIIILLVSIVITYYRYSSNNPYTVLRGYCRAPQCTGSIHARPS